MAQHGGGKRRSRLRRLAQGAGRLARLGGRALGMGVVAGLGTYGAVKLGQKALRPLAKLRRVRRAVPQLAAGIRRNFDTPSAHDWGATAGIFAAGDVLTEGLTHGAKRLHRLLGGRKLRQHRQRVEHMHRPRRAVP